MCKQILATSEIQCDKRKELERQVLIAHGTQQE